MSQQPLNSTPLGTNAINGTASPSKLIPFGTKFPKPTLRALPMNLPKDPDPEPSFPDSSKKYNWPNDTNSGK